MPVPPTINHAYRNAYIDIGKRKKRAMRVLTPEAQRWVDRAKKMATKAITEQGWVIPENKKIVCEITTFYPDKRRRDCMNGDKVYFDALEGLVYKDDKWILPRHMDFDVDKANPRREAKFYVKEI